MLTKEIEYQSLEIELCNKKIREANDRIAQRKEELKKTEADIADRTADLNQKREELDEILKETAEEEEALRQKANKARRENRAPSAQARSSVSVRMPATDSASFMCSATPAVAVSPRFRPSANSTSRCIRKFSCANTADVFSSILNWQV